MKVRQQGYSLAELLIVVAIVGLISLVGVPAFISYFNSMRVNTALREFTTEIRGARQRAVARNRPVKVSLQTGAGERTYRIYDGSTDLSSWTLIGGDRELPEYVYLHQTTFQDGDTTADGWSDMVFRPNGTVGALNGTSITNLPTEQDNGVQRTRVVVRTDTKVPYNQFMIYFEPSGRLSSTRSNF